MKHVSAILREILEQPTTTAGPNPYQLLLFPPTVQPRVRRMRKPPAKQDVTRKPAA